jgi:starch synthase
MPDSPLKVLFLSAEVAPFAKTGGLADVAGALPKALHALGQDVRVVTPRYQQTDAERFDLRVAAERITVPMEGRPDRARIFEGQIAGGTPVYFIDEPRYFGREAIYGYNDDGERFIHFSRAALELARHLAWRPDIIHCNDWHTGIVPNWLRTVYRSEPFFADAATVFTIHNLAYQGIFDARVLEVAGIAQYGFIYQAEIPELALVVDLMGRGIYFADVVSTVSEQYAREILTPEFGERLDPLLRERRDRLFGITNGIDYEEFDPATDPCLVQNFDADRLDLRAANKAALQREVGLPERPDTLLLGMISRLADQKGLDIVAQAAEPLLRNQDIQLVVLGTGDPHYHNVFNWLEQRFPERAAVFLTFDAPLAQRIYGGSDAFLMPSRYEPCGLGQMIAMRYGSLPIVRATGGLVDTVQDYDPRTDTGTGYVFEPYDFLALHAAIVRALEGYKYRDRWRATQRRAMAQDFSWASAARKYVDLYARAQAFHRAGPPAADRPAGRASAARAGQSRRNEVARS